MLSATASQSLQQNEDARRTSRCTVRRIAGALGPCGFAHATGGAARAVASAAAAASRTVLLRMGLRDVAAWPLARLLLRTLAIAVTAR
jgi:hypothetical protein